MRESAQAQHFRGHWLTAMFVTIISMGIALVAIPNLFPTNDDTYAQLIMAGNVSAEPTGYTSFINYGLCWAVSRLFLLFPSVPWWTLTHLFALFLAITFINRTTFVIIETLNIKQSLLKRIITCILADILLFGVLMARMQFTTTGSVLMAAAIFGSCACIGLKETQRSSMISGIVWSALLGGLGYSFRVQSGYLGFAFWAFAIVAIAFIFHGHSIKERLNKIKAPLRAFTGALCISIVLFGVHTAAYSSPQWQSELRLASALAAFTDYPRTPYDKNPALYEAVDWDEDLLELAGNWFFMDERINSSTLEQINDGNQTWLDNLLENPGGTLRSRLGELTKPVGMSYLAFFVVSMLLISYLGNNKSSRVLSALVGVLAFSLLGYLAIRGRLPERAELSVLIPAIACLASMMPRALVQKQMVSNEIDQSETNIPYFVIGSAAVLIGGLALAKLSGTYGKLVSMVIVAFTLLLMLWRLAPSSRSKVSRLMQKIPAVALGVLIAVCGIASIWQYGWLRDSHALAAERATNITKYYDYVSEHPDTLFIQDYNSALTPQDPWLTEWPTNQTAWGGWRYCYSWFDQAMKQAGFDGTPKSDDLLKDNVRFVSGSRETDELMEHYLEGLYGPVEFQEEKRFTRTQENGDIIIYKIVPDSEA